MSVKSLSAALIFLLCNVGIANAQPSYSEIVWGTVSGAEPHNIPSHTDTSATGEEVNEMVLDLNYTALDQHKHHFGDIMDFTSDGIAVPCADKWSIPFHGGGQQNSGEPDGWCDLFSTFRDNGITWSLFDGALSFFAESTGTLSAPWHFRHLSQLGATGTKFGLKIELGIEDAAITDTAVLWLQAVPSNNDYSFPDIALIRHEEDIGVARFGIRYLNTKDGGTTTTALHLASGGTINAMDIGENNIVTSCDDHYNAAQFGGNPDGLADRDGLTALCTDVYDTCSSPPAPCVQDTNAVSDGLCDSDAETEVEYDSSDENTLPQAFCHGGTVWNSNLFPMGCPDTFCDVDAVTAWPDQESFPASNFEEVLDGGSVDDADAQHTHDSKADVSAEDYTMSNVTPDRVFDPTSTTQSEIGQVLGTLIDDYRNRVF